MSTTSETTAGADAPLRKIGRYQLCFEIASGGMATVYLARVDGPGGFDKLVALKTIHPHLAKDGDFIAMFFDEARIASRITHPNVCGVFDIGFEDEHYFLAMEYLFGETLSRVHKAVKADDAQRFSSRLPLYVAKMVSDACEGLHAAHELRGDDGRSLDVVHRDVSPHNLFVTYDGSVRVVDFGVAKAAGALHQTATGEVKGKLAYMAPEQLRRRRRIDRRVDVWGVGVVLHELLTTHRLFRRDSEGETVISVLEDDVPLPSRVNPAIPRELDSIVMRALERDPDRRYDSARELGRDLRRFLASHARGEPIGIAEIAEWMDELFHEDKIKKLALVEQARSMDPSSLPRMIGADTTGTSDVASAQSRIQVRTETDVATRRRDGSSLLSRHGTKFGFAALGALFATVGLVVVTGLRREEPPPPAERPEVGEAPRARPPPFPPPSPAVPLPLPPTMERIERLPDLPVIPPPLPLAQPPTRPSTPTASSPTPEPREARVEPGWVNVSTPGGWADVYHRGVHVGRSPGRVRLPAGNLTLILRPHGDGAPIRRTVRVLPGGTQRLVVPLR